MYTIFMLNDMIDYSYNKKVGFYVFNSKNKLIKTSCIYKYLHYSVNQSFNFIFLSPWCKYGGFTPSTQPFPTRGLKREFVELVCLYYNTLGATPTSWELLQHHGSYSSIMGATPTSWELLQHHGSYSNIIGATPATWELLQHHESYSNIMGANPTSWGYPNILGATPTPWELP